MPLFGDPPSSLRLATAWRQGVCPADHPLPWLHVLRSLPPAQFDGDAAAGWRWLADHPQMADNAWPSWSALHRFHLGLRDTEFSLEGEARWGRLVARPIAGRLDVLPSCVGILDQGAEQTGASFVWFPRLFRPADVDRWGAQERFTLIHRALEGAGAAPNLDGFPDADSQNPMPPDTWGTRLMVGVAVDEALQPPFVGADWITDGGLLLPSGVRVGQVGTLGEALAERATLHLDLAVALAQPAWGIRVRACRVDRVPGDPTSRSVHLVGEDGGTWGPCLLDACGLPEPDDLNAELQVWAKNLHTKDRISAEDGPFLG